jgi:hypothetical protein
MPAWVAGFKGEAPPSATLPVITTAEEQHTYKKNYKQKGRTDNNTSAAPQKRQNDGKCWTCGESTHIRQFCPKNSQN